MSQVELVLHDDPAEAYILMDFHTRDYYRHVIEKLAKKSEFSEIEVAQKSIDLAKKGAELSGKTDRAAHVGYWLIGKGLSQLEDLIKIRYSFSEAFKKTIFRFPLFFYLGSIIVLTLVLTWCELEIAKGDGIAGWHFWVLGFLLTLCTSYLSIAFVNWLVTMFVSPNPLPRLDYSKGIPPESRTLVVVPTMLLSIRNIEELAEALEVRFLANQDKNLYFGLLTDFKDSAQEKSEEDDQLIQAVSERINELNEKYKKENKDSFFLFHRPRKWNPNDRIWMGYERKRGKLADLNALLRGEVKNNFSLIIGNTRLLSKVKYVITLDTDTQLARDSARQFIGAMSHPLNKPKYDNEKRRVTEGYSILQPRVAISLPGMNRSKYAMLFGSEAGIDPYTRAISDVYQDLFGEGSFIGKGIYDVDAFSEALNDRFPENRILSHDLVEGCYARSGLLSDVLLFEEYPASYQADVNRRSRWIRGDWQLIPWLLPILPRFNGAPRKNPLSLLSWWKILDNLRRSLVPFALTLLLFAGWTILSSPWFWTLVVIGIILIPSLIHSVAYLVQKPEEVLLRQHIKGSLDSVLRQLYQSAFVLVSLPYEAYYSLDALLRTCWRMIISKKRLLEWNSATIDHYHSRFELIESYRIMWASPIVALLTATALSYFSPRTLLMVWPILGLWFIFPVIVWWISKPNVADSAKLSEIQYGFLRELSRKTWSFFETFVGSDDNWLPPDNYQEYPVSVIAHRTSPTNIGLSLLANLSAYDFGYIFSGELIDRTNNAFNTMQSLERYQGHFFNWYDTQSLKPLRPLYISSVDSGNLAGNLLTLQQGFLSLPDQLIPGTRIFEGIDDTFQILISKSGKSKNNEIILFRRYLNSVLKEYPVSVGYLYKCLEKLTSASAEIVNKLTSDSGIQFGIWAKNLLRQCQSAYDELTYLIPWLSHPFSSEIQNTFPGMNSIPTLREISKWTISSMDIDSGDPKINLEVKSLFIEAVENAKGRIEKINSIVSQSGAFADMKLRFSI